MEKAPEASAGIPLREGEPSGIEELAVFARKLLSSAVERAQRFAQAALLAGLVSAADVPPFGNIEVHAAVPATTGMPHAGDADVHLAQAPDERLQLLMTQRQITGALLLGMVTTAEQALQRTRDAQTLAPEDREELEYYLATLSEFHGNYNKALHDIIEHHRRQLSMEKMKEIESSRTRSGAIVRALLTEIDDILKRTKDN